MRSPVKSTLLFQPKATGSAKSVVFHQPSKGLMI
ncbi:hypothetical protein B23_3673 [Geobacillus thermoleovorans B23]|nr:hypothetical protein B23_3673 [Geobacillus thermoleovorans B23]